MRDIKIDTSVGGTWDVIPDNSELGLELVEDEDEVAQRVAVATKTFVGEWLYDTDLGLPWFEEILVRDPNIPRVVDRFRALWIGIDGVLSVLSLKLTFNEADRELIVDGAINTEFGPVGLGFAV